MRDLRVGFATEDGPLQAVDGVSFDLAPGEVLAIVGESGSGKSVAVQTVVGLTRSPGAQIEGSARLGERGADRGERRRAAPGPRRADRDGLPGPDDLLQPGLPGRRPDRRGDPRPPAGGRQGRGAPAGGRAARLGRHPRPRAAGRRLPARALGRDAAAGDDRDGAGARARGADRRRADDRARRHRPGPDPCPARASSTASADWRRS